MSAGQTFHERGGRFIHARSSAGRRITIAYTRENGEIRYGATVFKPAQVSDQYTKEGNRVHAVERYYMAPVYVKDDPEWGAAKRDREIRNAITVHGCHS
jgi:hypothetical protein